MVKKLSDIIESSPLVLDGDIVIGTADGQLYRLDGETGEQKWLYKADDRFAGGANWFSKGEQKIIVAGNYDNFVHAVNFENGQKVWTYETENFINGTSSYRKWSDSLWRLRQLHIRSRNRWKTHL